MKKHVPLTLQENRVREGEYASDESYGMAGAFRLIGPKGSMLLVMSSGVDHENALGACQRLMQGPHAELGRDVFRKKCFLGRARMRRSIPPAKVGVRGLSSKLLAPLETHRDDDPDAAELAGWTNEEKRDLDRLIKDIRKIIVDADREWYPTVSRRRRYDVSRKWASHSIRLLKRPHWGVFWEED